VVPGSPGSDSNLRTVPVTPELRGYSDPTGMVVAEALQQQSGDRRVVYRIIKDDVPGILRMPPGLGRDPAIASRLNVVEAGTLSAGGNEVVHPVVLELLQQSNVRLLVCSGESDEEDGTVIEQDRLIEAGERIAGIALQEVVSYVVNDIRMEHQAGVVANVMDAFSANDVPLVDVVTGRGIISTYLTAANHAANSNRLRDMLSGQYGETFTVRGDSEDDGISIVTLVGEAMSQDLGAHASAVSDALNIGLDHNIAIGPYWPSPNSDAIYITVPTRDAARYACAAYDRFFGA
jgi:aspartokinase